MMGLHGIGRQKRDFAFWNRGVGNERIREVVARYAYSIFSCWAVCSPLISTIFHRASGVRCFISASHFVRAILALLLLLRRLSNLLHIRPPVCSSVC
jgi:hypothetical protein